MPNLLLVPTPAEAGFVSDSVRDANAHWTIQICGFGPIAAAARTSALIARHSPAKVILVGIAGSFDTQACPIGTAREFQEVACYGIGVGSGDSFKSATQLGWLLFDGDETDTKLGDRIKLDGNTRDGSEEPCGLLLTSPTASADSQDATLRLGEFPEAICEDMEGFAVAASCLLASIPLRIVRGVSNSVGDRDKANWNIAGAMRAACELVNEMMKFESRS